MRVEGRDVLLSASDLMRFMACKHATALDLRYARGEPLEPADDAEDAKILQKQGNEHEFRYLAKLKAEGHSVIEFGRDGGLAADAQATRAALSQGESAFFGPPWGGWSDFLIRVEKPSALGDFSYEVVDTKLKRKPDPKHILQLVLYLDLLAKVQGREPEHAHIELGNGERFSFRLKEYSAYARHARSRLEDFVFAPPATSPDPVKMCGLCRWRNDCQGQWEATDSLSLVAGIPKSAEQADCSGYQHDDRAWAANPARVQASRSDPAKTDNPGQVANSKACWRPAGFRAEIARSQSWPGATSRAGQWRCLLRYRRRTVGTAQPNALALRKIASKEILL
jgi:hypothetical protein